MIPDTTLHILVVKLQWHARGPLARRVSLWCQREIKRRGR